MRTAAVLKARQAALSTALQQVGCSRSSFGTNPIEDVKAMVQSSAAEIKAFLLALGLEHLASADWKLIKSGTISFLWISHSCGR